MYELAKESNVKELLSFFETDLKNCLYSYIDLKKYGIQNENLQIFIYKNQDKLTTVATKYYNGLQLFHDHHFTFPIQSTMSLIEKLNPSIISSTLDVIEALAPLYKKEWEVEKGYVTSLSQTLQEDFPYSIEEATQHDLNEISRLICMDEGLGGHYSVPELEAQLSTRMKEQFGRNYIIRQQGTIVCHAATYAEIDNLAVISGVITHPKYRGMGFAAAVVSKLCKDLLLEGKQPHLFYYTKEAEHLYQKIGFHLPSQWAKLVRKAC